jgi:hypothetical protein
MHAVPAHGGTPEIYAVHGGRLEGMGLVDPAQMDGPDKREPGSPTGPA